MNKQTVFDVYSTGTKPILRAICFNKKEAHLVGAAPALLKAAEIALNALTVEYSSKQGGGLVSLEKGGHAIAVLKDALAKAGKES